MFSLFRFIYRALFVKGQPLHQVLVGIVLIPVGSAIAWASLNADPYHYYPYFAVAGVVFAIFGVVLIGKGILGFTAGKTVQPGQGTGAYNGNGQAQYPQPSQAPYTGPAQYPQTPYSGPAQYSQPSQE